VELHIRHDWSSQSTLNTLPPEARIYYRYHPYAKKTFKVLQRSSGKRHQVTLSISPGKTITVPEWMLQPEASRLQVDICVEISHKTLLELLDLLNANCFALEPTNTALEKLNGAKKL